MGKLSIKACVKLKEKKEKNVRKAGNVFQERMLRNKG